MLGKLLKYETAATARIFLPIYGLILLLAGINKLSWNYDFDSFDIPRSILMSVYVMLIVSAFVITLVVTIQRFYRNLLGDEGYLSFTLPVKPHSHIDAKLIVTLMWAVLSILVTVLSIFIFVANADTLEKFSRACAQIRELYQAYGISAHIITLEIIIMMVVSFWSSILQIYASVTIGNLAGRHKLLAGVGAYLGFGIVEQTITSVLVTVFHQQIQDYFSSFKDFAGATYPAEPIEVGLLILILFSAAFAVAFYIFTNWMLTNKLNLE
ncbi:MAG: ABC transporter permease [Oscillospiraceae bacterium]|jgi:hypothetical protein